MDLFQFLPCLKNLELMLLYYIVEFKRLMKKKLIKKFTIEIDESLLGVGVKASVGINRDPKLKRNNS